MTIEFPLPRFIVQCNFAFLVTSIFLITFIFTNVSFSRKVNNRFLSICFYTFLLTVSDNLRYITYHLPEPDIWRYLSTASGYTLRPVIIYLLVSLAGRRCKAKIGYSSTIPLYINGAIAFLSCIPSFHGLMFDFTAQNAFVRGTFGFLPYICCALYLVLLMYFIFKKTIIIRSELTIIFVIVVLGAIATAMESQLKFDLILSQTLMIGTVFYYLFMNVQVYKRDTLTELENRRCFYLELEKIKKKEFCIVSMDLNDLKLFNDTKGHAAGDEALVTCTEIMQECFPKKCKLYRTGGDEFMAICEGYSLFQVQEITSRFQNKLSSTIYRVACGASEYHPGYDVEKVISESDRLMYENKRQLKEK